MVEMFSKMELMTKGGGFSALLSLDVSEENRGDWRHNHSAILFIVAHQHLNQILRSFDHSKICKD